MFDRLRRLYRKRNWKEQFKKTQDAHFALHDYANNSLLSCTYNSYMQAQITTQKIQFIRVVPYRKSWLQIQCQKCNQSDFFKKILLCSSVH